MTRLLKLDPRMRQAELRKLLAELKEVIAPRQAMIATLHPTGEAFAAGVLEAIAALEARSVASVVEKGEADDAQAAHTLLFEQLRQYLLVLKRRVRTIARALEAEEPVTARGLLRDYGIQGNRGKLTRASHALTQLEQAVIANQRPEHRALLGAWGLSAAILDQGAALQARVEPTRAALVKERGEAERAVDARQQAEDEAIAQCNMMLRLIEDRVEQLELTDLLGLDADPEADSARELAQALGSVLNKYRSQLTRQKPAEADDAIEPTVLPGSASLHDVATKDGGLTP